MREASESRTATDTDSALLIYKPVIFAKIGGRIGTQLKMSTYRFKVLEGYNETIPYKECKKACCDCGCNPIRLFRLELEKRLKESDLPCATDQQLPPENFKAVGDLNPLKIVADIYRSFFHDNWETCLSRKQNIRDCIYGCNSSVSDKDQPLFHPHQWCGKLKAYRPGFDNMAEKLENDILSKEFRTFPDIVDYLNELKKSNPSAYKGYGLLSIYDTALRLAWHVDPQTDKPALLPREIYLHQGAKVGAICLFKLGLLKGVETLKAMNKVSTLESSRFPEPFDSIEPHHLENLLCIFHPLFKQWEVDVDSGQNVGTVRSSDRCLRSYRPK